MKSTRPGLSASTNSVSWLTMIIVPGQAASACATPTRDGGSRLLVGSSSSSRLCRPATSWARASLVFSPPDAPAVRRIGETHLDLALALRCADLDGFEPVDPFEDRLGRARALLGLAAHHLGQHAEALDLGLLALRQRGHPHLLGLPGGEVLRVSAAVL